jgi:hypothetical protein
MKWALKNLEPQIVPVGSVGDFGFRRSFYHHPGIDIYCGLGQEVVAIEAGIVTNVEYFTGPNANPTSPWWNETWSIMIQGTSGALGYCELKPMPNIHKGTVVLEGETIAIIIPVLKRDKGNGTTMLHFEHYLDWTQEHVTWILDSKRPPQLLNPRALLNKIIASL